VVVWKKKFRVNDSMSKIAAEINIGQRDARGHLVMDEAWK
jgi:hypothetical protein